MTSIIEGSYRSITLHVPYFAEGGDIVVSGKVDVKLSPSRARKLIEDISNTLGIESRFEKAVPTIETALRDRHPATKVFEENFIQQIEYAPYSFLMDELTDADLVLLLRVKFDYQDDCYGIDFLDFENIKQANAVFEPVHSLLIFIKDEEP